MRNVGVVLAKPKPLVGYEPLTTDLFDGLNEVATQAGMRVVTRVVLDVERELEVYRDWHASGAVDGVVLLGIARDDTRITELHALGVPFVAVIDLAQSGNFSAVTIDNSAVMSRVMGYLVARGHTRIGFVSGPEEIESNYHRVRAFTAHARAFDVEMTVFHHEEGSAATAAVLHAASLRDRPTALILGDDVAAVESLGALASVGLNVPTDMSVVAWNDATRCQLAQPAITAMSNEARNVGVLVGECLIELAAGASDITRSVPSAFVVERATVAALPKRVRAAAAVMAAAKPADSGLR
jgi:DNA-binding LacI/PurR family transcriptional regulator